MFREEKWEVGGEELLDFSFFTFPIVVNKKTYRMYSAHIFQTLIILQNTLCSHLPNTLSNSKHILITIIQKANKAIKVKCKKPKIKAPKLYSQKKEGGKKISFHEMATPHQLQTLVMFTSKYPIIGKKVHLSG